MSCTTDAPNHSTRSISLSSLREQSFSRQPRLTGSKRDYKFRDKDTTCSICLFIARI